MSSCGWGRRFVDDLAARIEIGAERVKIRSVLTCEAKRASASCATA